LAVDGNVGRAAVAGPVGVAGHSGYGGHGGSRFKNGDMRLRL
jgi:hypothetical protein